MLTTIDMKHVFQGTLSNKGLLIINDMAICKQKKAVLCYLLLPKAEIADIIDTDLEA
jgi:hypothetical protein